MPNIYTQSQLQNDINQKIKGKVGILSDVQSIMNQGVRQVLADLDLLTTRRRTPLVPALFNGLFEYACPTDLKGYSIISVQNQKWTKTPFWSLVPYEQFLRRQDPNTIAISDYDGLRKIYIKSQYAANDTVVANLDTLTSGGGTWAAYGDATNLSVDKNNNVEGMGSIKFDISSAGGTTAGIVNSTLNQSDLSQYFTGHGECIVWANITSITNLTNYIIRIGSDASNYYTKTITAQSDGTAFVNGINILRFDLSTFTTVGSPDSTKIDYCALFMTKTSGKVSEVGYSFDNIVFKRGEINNLYYYSGYGWQSSVGTYKQNSTTSSDVLNAGDEEYELILAKCAELAADDADEDRVSEKQAARYKELRKMYRASNPSEALTIISTTQDFVKL
jgi:hypothetical protein